MSSIAIHFFLFVLFFTKTQSWTRYERRILTCGNGSLECKLDYPDKWTKSVQCRTEKIPEKELTPLNKITGVRIACPIGCRPHIVQKDSGNNRKCATYSTFGKYYDEMEKDWFIWFSEPCKSVFTTNCDFQE